MIFLFLLMVIIAYEIILFYSSDFLILVGKSKSCHVTVSCQILYQISARALLWVIFNAQQWCGAGHKYHYKLFII